MFIQVQTHDGFCPASLNLAERDSGRWERMTRAVRDRDEARRRLRGEKPLELAQPEAPKPAEQLELGIGGGS